MKIRSARRVLGWAVTVAVLALIAAGIWWFGQLRAQPGDSDLGPLAVVSEPSEIVLPLDQYSLSDSQQFLVDSAVYTLGKQCMARFDLVPPGPPPQRPVTDSRLWRYGVLDPALAAKWGYARPPDTSGSAPAAPPPPAAVAVWFGKGERTYQGIEIPNDGCQAQARRDLDQGQAPPDLNFVERLEVEANRRAENDPRLRNGFAQWSQCMQRAGFNYRDPWSANDDPTIRDSSDTTNQNPSARQIATAIADARCKQQTNLVGLWMTLESHYQQHLLNDQRRRLDAIRAATDRETKHVNEILAHP